MRRRHVLQAGLWAALAAACGRQERSPAAARAVPPLPSVEPAPSLGPPGSVGPAPSLEPAPSRQPTPARSHAPVAPGPRHDGAAVEIRHGDRAGSQIALTFHGAGDAKLALALLAAAERDNAKVTVLAVGRWLADHPSLARRILDGGHELGNHTYTHPALARLSATDAYDEIRWCADVLRKLTGSPGAWFRPSGTPRSSPRILAAAGRAGYRRALAYDLDPRDYADPGAHAVAARVAAGIRPGAVVSLHLGHEGTVAALPRILEVLQRRGLSAVTASELLA